MKYIRTERSEHDPLRRKRVEDLEDHDPIFLTELGTPYNREAFYYHWNKLFKPAQKQFKDQDKVEFSPHDIRHLRVTRAIKKIKKEAQGDKALEEELTDGFWRLMGWKSSLTMDTYTHLFNQRKALVDVMLAEDEDENELVIRSSQDDTSKASILQHPGEDIPTNTPVILSNDDDEFGWYEE